MRRSLGKNPSLDKNPSLGKKSWPALITVMILSLLLSGCFRLTRDTCTQGDNMTDPAVSGTFDATSTAPQLRITWSQGTERGADLPAAYFDEVELSLRTDPAVANLIGSVTHSAERELTVTFIELSSHLATSQTIDFILSFPDRLGFIDCTHPGMRDQYFLEVSLQFDAANELIDATFEQTKLFGPL